MKNIRVFYLFLEVKFYVYFNRHVFAMISGVCFFLISPFFGVFGRLWFVIVAFSWYLRLYVCKIDGLRSAS